MTNGIRRFLVGGEQDFAFAPADDIELSVPDRIHLYIHVPFCRSLCPYCPYNRVLYDETLVARYFSAMMAEIEQYYQRLGPVCIDSVYIGGGTPSTCPRHVGMILEKLNERFTLSGDISIESNPNDITPQLLHSLVSWGVNLLSIGVQSFEEENLRFLERGHTAGILHDKIEMALSSSLETVNLDLMFALPHQDSSALARDLEQAIASQAQQLTTYPLFCFPYTTVGRWRKLQGVQLPPLIKRKKMYHTIHHTLLEAGYDRVSVWGFKKGDGPRYSSVTREHYLGLGAGAASHFPGQMFMNTFSLPEYIHRCNTHRLPVALDMKLSPALSSYYWLYWRLYDTYLPRDTFATMLGQDWKAQGLIKALHLLGMAKSKPDVVELTQRGSFWVHLAQNYFFLHYINRVWSVARKMPFPGRISI